MTDLAVVIVTWNVRELALNALRSLFVDLDAHGPHAEVYVVDSASSDGTVEAIAQTYPQVKLVASQENVGFAAGNNLALREIGFGANVAAARLPRAIYLLNPDTLTHASATCTLYNALMADAGVGLVGARLTYEDGSFQHSAFHFPGLRQLWAELFPTPGRLIEHPFNGRYPRQFYGAGQPFAVDCVLGATMMLRREVIQQTGMFDEQFYMYCEEIDWAWRIRKAGWEIRCVPTAHVTHLSGQSTTQMPVGSVVNLWTSRLRLYRKHYPVWKVALARLMVAVGMRQKLRALRQAPASVSEKREALHDAFETVYQLARGR